ncbi:MAG: hypothetical protein HY847_07225 [Betaproteobacteria bacterium]|nr:hypothetical protein [Betaproteobacteria bacterium]
MSFKFIVSLDGIEKLRGGLTQATLFLISHYGSVDEGISAGVKIRPEWLSTPLTSSPKSASPSATLRSPGLSNSNLQKFGPRPLNV